jgi:polysaccharide export outer membrane protein
MNILAAYKPWQWLIALIAMLVVFPVSHAQENIADSKRLQPATVPVEPSMGKSPAPVFPAGVPIGPGDLLEINVYTVYGAPDVSQKTRVSNTGNVALPFVGDVHVAGLTAEKAEEAIQKAFRDGQFLNNPHVSILIDEYATQGVSIMGEVNKPAVYPVVASRRLFDMISEAGGLTARAGKSVLITHRDSPDKPVTLNLADQKHAGGNNVDIMPGDTIVVPTAGLVYVIGNVAKPGGFTMDNSESITVMQAIALAQGIQAPAALDRTRIIRKTPGGTQEIPLRLSKILAAKSPDVTLTAGDVLFIPNSAAKGAARRTAEAILSAATGSVIYHPPW